MFFPPQTASSGAIEAAVNADYKKLLQILEKQPSIMFEKNQSFDIDGKKINKSPLEYFAYAMDSSGIKLCWQVYQKFLSSDKAFRAVFIEQVRDTDNSFDLRPLLNSYEQYFTKHEEFISICNKYTKPFNKMYDITREEVAALCKEHIEIKEKIMELKQAWLAIGAAQLVALPRNILKKMGSPARMVLKLLSFSYTEENPIGLQTKDDYEKCESEERLFFEKFPFLSMETDVNYGDAFIFYVPTEEDISSLSAGDKVLMADKFSPKRLPHMLNFFGESHTIACGNSVGGAHLVSQPLGIHHRLIFKARQDYDMFSKITAQHQADISIFLENIFIMPERYND